MKRRSPRRFWSVTVRAVWRSTPARVWWHVHDWGIVRL